MVMTSAGGLTLAVLVGASLGFITMCVLVLWAAFRAGRQCDDGARANCAEAEPDEALMRSVASERSVSIDGNLVPALRRASYANLATAAESVAALTSAVDQDANPAACIPLVIRIGGAFALLDALGWKARAPESAVAVTARLHTPLASALERGLLLAETRAEAEGNIAEREALAQLGHEVRSARGLSEEELEHVVSLHLQQIALGVAELEMIAQSDLWGPRMLESMRWRVARVSRLVNGAIALSGVDAHNRSYRRAANGRRHALPPFAARASRRRGSS